MPPIHLKQATYVRTHDGGDESGANVMFYHDAILDQVATDRAGRAIYRDVEMVSISFPGNQYSDFHEKVNESHKIRFKRAYEAFLAAQEIAHEGTPIEQLTVLSRAQINELKYMGVHTIEAGAGLTEQAVQGLGMGGNRIRTMCVNYMKQAEGLAPLAQLTSENETLKDQLAAQQAQIADLNNMMVGMQKQLSGFNEAPKLPQQIVPGMGDPLTIGGPTAPAASSLDTIGEERPRSGPAPKRRVA